MINLKIITSTTRNGNKGLSIAHWISELAQQFDDFNVELLDLAEINLPIFDEPHHPRLQQYEFEHTKNWSAKINEADAFIITLAEYNYGFPAPIKNAIDYLHNEWRHKPLGIVSYGGVSAGLRAAQMLKQVVTTLNMMPIAEQVNIPFFSKFISQDGIFKADETLNKSAEAMLSALEKWANALKPMRS
jgi:NAD(P)H-dependent FMN reductase